MRKINYSILCIMAALSGQLMAQQVSVTTAQSRAYEFLQSQAKRASIRQSDVAQPNLELVYTSERSSDRRPMYYVFNQGADQGFVIMGGDESAREILAYCDHGSFDIDNLPDNFRWWLSQYEQQISAAIDLGPVEFCQNRRASARTTASREKIGPLVLTTWNQGSPYNDAIAADLKSQTGATGNYGLVTGCVATAMAQVMYFHRWPETNGVGSHEVAKGNIFTPRANFAETTYDWDNMLLSYDGNYTAVQGNAVATLMYHAGVSVDMKYGNSSSGGSNASSYDIPTGLSTYFNYDKSAHYIRRDCFTDAEWEEMVYQELAARRPVLYGGHQEKGGHQFICDGYDPTNNTFHFNWGWGGNSDAFCPLSGTKALTPTGTGIGGGAANTAYTGSQDIILNVKPNAGGKEPLSVSQYDYFNDGNFGLYDDSQLITDYQYTEKNSKNLSLKFTIWNTSSTITGFQLGVKAKDVLTGRCYFWEGITMSLQKTGIANRSVPFNLNELTYNGVYEISPVARPTQSDEWEDIPVMKVHKLPTVTMSCGESVVIVPKDITFSLDQSTVEVDRTIQISHDDYYQGDVEYTSSDNSIATVDADGMITGVKVGKVTITAKGSAMMLRTDKVFNATNASFEVEVSQLKKGVPEATLSATTIAIDQTIMVALTAGYDGTPTYSSSNPSVASISTDGIITGVAAGTTTISVTLPATTVWESATYNFEVQVINGSLFFEFEPYLNNDNNAYVDDMYVNYAIHNASSSKQTFYFLVRLYKLNSDGSTSYYGGKGFSNLLDANETYESAYSLSNFTNVAFVENQKYLIKFAGVDQQVWDNYWNYESIEFTYRSKLEVDYKITSAGVGTLILPFNAELPEGLKAYNCSGVNADGTLSMTAAPSLKRNTPYILMGQEGNYQFSGPNAIDAESFTVGKLKGALTDNVSFESGDYVLQNQNGAVSFYAYDPELKMPNNGICRKNRAFIHMGLTSADYEGFSISPELTAIENIEQDVTIQRPAGIYGLDGTRRNALMPGMNIVIQTDGSVKKCYIK